MISRLISYAILPAQFLGTRLGKLVDPRYSKEYIDNSRKNFKKNLNSKEVTIKTKDRVNLNGMLFKKESLPRSKVWINFNGNGMAYELLDSNQIKKIQNLGFDFLAFNYRGVLKSKGSRPTQRGLIEDGKAVIKYANNLGYADLFIHAHSLGGAIATNAVAELKNENPNSYRKIKLIVDRTFASIKAVIKTYKLFRIIKLIFIKIVNFVNWNIRVKKAWEKIDIKKCLFYALKDLVIPLPSSLFKKVQETTDKNIIFKLTTYDHFMPLSTSDLINAISVVS